jgi:hypothetical protein
MTLFKTILSHDDIKSLVNLIQSNNEYNTDSDEIEDWKDIVTKLKTSEQIFTTI